MTAPNMPPSLERSLRNCSLNHHHGQNSGVLGEGSSSSDDIDVPPQHFQHRQSSSDTTLELNSHVSLPYHWEQCLDLKTGEIYYINWRNGMKAKEDPRRTHDYYSEEDGSYESEESSSPVSSSRNNYYSPAGVDNRNHVLVVAACKTCLMYIMVPKHLQHCPKCSGQLFHFHTPENASP